MFYAPSIVATKTTTALDAFELYSDMHKDAIGCRPGAAQYAKEAAMSPLERGVEIETLQAWITEEERINALRNEVARFDFSRGMEYLMRREGLTQAEAFKTQIRRCKIRPYPNDEMPSWEECMEDVLHYGWDFIAMDCRLPACDGPKLQEMWENFEV